MGRYQELLGHYHVGFCNYSYSIPFIPFFSIMLTMLTLMVVMSIMAIICTGPCAL